MCSHQELSQGGVSFMRSCSDAGSNRLLLSCELLRQLQLVLARLCRPELVQHWPTDDRGLAGDVEEMVNFVLVAA